MPHVLLYTPAGLLARVRRPAGFARQLELEPVPEGVAPVAGALLERTPEWWAQDDVPLPGRFR